MARNNNLPSRRDEGGVSAFSDIFDRYARDFFAPLFDDQSSGDFRPKVEVSETDKKYEICAELPGLKEEDINVTLKDNNLILEGDKKQESKSEDKGRSRSEFSYGSFYRCIPLRDEVDDKNVEASYQDGILTISLNKKEGEGGHSRKIPINRH